MKKKNLCRFHSLPIDHPKFRTEHDRFSNKKSWISILSNLLHELTIVIVEAL